MKEPILFHSFREFQKLDEQVVANKWFLPLVWTSKMLSQEVEDGNIQVDTFSKWMLFVFENEAFL